MNSSPTGDGSVSASEAQVVPPSPNPPRHTRSFLAVAGGGGPAPRPQEDEWKEVKRKRAKRSAEASGETRDPPPQSSAMKERDRSPAPSPSTKAASRKAKAADVSEEESSTPASSASSEPVRLVKGRPHRQHVHRGVGKSKTKPKSKAEPKPERSASATPFQHLVLRGAAEGGMDTADAIIRAMQARQQLSDWRFPEGVPRSAEDLHLRLGEMLESLMDCYPGSPLTLKERLYISSWQQEQIPRATELSQLDGAAPANLGEYAKLFRLRQPVLPPYMLAHAASLICARILVLEPVVDDPSSPDWNPAEVLWRVAQHFWPIDACNGGRPVPPSRVIVLASQYSARGLIGHSWAHPECELCSELPGEEIRIRLDLSPHPTCESFPEWQDDRGSATAHPFVSSEEEEPERNASVPHPVSPPVEGVAVLMEEHPGATELQARSSLMLTWNGARFNPIAASRVLGAQLEVFREPPASSTEATAGSRTTFAPPLPANTGKHATCNAARIRESEERLAASSHEDPFILAQHQALSDLARKAALSKAVASSDAGSAKQPFSVDSDEDQDGQAVVGRASAGCKPPPRQDQSPPQAGGGSGSRMHEDGRRGGSTAEAPSANDSNSSGKNDSVSASGRAKTGNQRPCPTAVNASRCLAPACADRRTAEQRTDEQSLGEQLQEIEEAVRAVSQLSGATDARARQQLMWHLQHTNEVEDAAAAAIADLQPPLRELPSDGVTFVERLLGRGVKPATLRQMALNASGDGAAQTVSSELRPRNLSRLWDQHLAEPSLSQLQHGERTRLAHRHAVGALHNEALDALAAANKQTGCFDSPAATAQSGDLRAHPNSAIRMAAAHEARAAQQNRDGPIVVVAGGGTKLQQWKQGAEKDGKGFFWSTKLAVQQSWEAANRMDGEHAYRTFKSIVHQSMVSVICFEIGLGAAEWETIGDTELLCRIDAVLKPKDSTEYFLKLSTYKIALGSANGNLATRYRAFAEPFINTMAEAVAAGMPVSEEQAKTAFKSGCSASPLCKLWISENKWKTVADMHMRIVKGIKQYESDSVLRALDSGDTAGRQEQTAPAPHHSAAGHGNAGGGGSNRRQHVQLQQPASPPAQQQQQPWRQQSAQPAPIGAFRPQQQQPALINQVSGQQQYHHPGLDARGPNWHVPCEALGCTSNPCTLAFCQVCGGHHPTTQCRRRQHRDANTSGYYSDKRPGQSRLLYDGPPRAAGLQQRQASLPAAQQHSAFHQQPYAFPPPSTNAHFEFQQRAQQHSAYPLAMHQQQQRHAAQDHSFAPPPSFVRDGASHNAVTGGGATDAPPRNYTAVRNQQRPATINQASQHQESSTNQQNQGGQQ